MLRHLSHVLPVFVLRKAHDGEDSVQLIVMIRIAGLDVLLTTVEDRLGGKQLSENATDGPNVWGRKLEISFPFRAGKGFLFIDFELVKYWAFLRE